MAVLVTGGLGLIGQGLTRALRAGGIDVEVLDIRGLPSDGTFGDVRCIDDVRDRVARCQGIVHLAGVSRVIWGERDPAGCWTSIVDGTSNVLRAALESSRRPRPWVIYASSREVYGQVDRLPVDDGAALKPINVYGWSKAAAEGMVQAARAAGLVTSIVRFSNVFGSIMDHHDRVAPAFARAAAEGSSLRVEGSNNVLDLTWVEDVCAGVVTLCGMMQDESRAPPPIHFVSGRGTTLLELATMACSFGSPEARIEHWPARDYDVSRFRGCPERAAALLGWRATTSLEEGMGRLVEAFRHAPEQVMTGLQYEPHNPNISRHDMN